MAGLVRSERVGDVAVLSLARPDRRNALSEALVEALSAALGAAEASARAIVLRADGRAFCAGGDLGGRTSADGPERRSVLDTHVNPLLRTIRDLGVPIITAVNGAAVGAGASLALAGDLVVAGESAFLQFAFNRVGLIPDMGASFLLTRTVGRVRANDLLLLGERLPARAALAMGLVTGVEPDDALDAAALRLAERLARGPTVALGEMRRLTWRAWESMLADELERESALQARVAQSADYREGVAAFRAKRDPVFTGQ